MKAPTGQWLRIHTTYAINGTTVQDITHTQEDVTVNASQQIGLLVTVGHIHTYHYRDYYRVHITAVDEPGEDTDLR